MKNCLKNFKRFLELEDLSDNSVQTYYKEAEMFMKRIAIDKISKQAVEDYILELKLNNFSPSTINKKINAIKYLVKFLNKIDNFNISGIDEIKRMKTPRSLPKPIDKEQLKKIIEFVPETITDFRNYVLLNVCYLCGLRVSELVNIKISDINLKSNSIFIVGKGKKQRIVHFHEKLKENIIKLIELYREKNIYTDYLFPSSHNYQRPITTRTAQSSVDVVCKKLNIEHINPHRLRHSFATYLHEKGVDLKTIQILLGHNQITTTEIYTKISQVRIKKDYESANLHQL